MFFKLPGRKNGTKAKDSLGISQPDTLLKNAQKKNCYEAGEKGKKC